MKRLAVAVWLLATACQTSGPDADTPGFVPDRHDYYHFASGYPDLLEPNYLPFMVHQLADPEGGADVLTLCRWPADAMPLAVYVASPTIPDELQNEFNPRAPGGYVTAVRAALDIWEETLEGLVRFRAVDDPEDADLVIELLGEQAWETDEGEVRVLGMTSLGDSCRPRSWARGAERLNVDFAVESMRIFVADRFGLLAEDQVEWIALHEIGHALGMRGHSPIPADLMYEIVRDRMTVREGLSSEDARSFLNLYRLPSGTVFGRARVDDEPPEPTPAPTPTGDPKLTLAPYVDAVRGFALRTPAGWMRVDTAMGMVAVDGVTWDYTASFQVVVQRFPTIESYVERYGDYFARRARVLRIDPLVIKGRRAVQALLASRGEDKVEEITLIETGDGRLVVVIADCPRAQYGAYAAWFDATLRSLEIWDFPRS